MAHRVDESPCFIVSVECNSIREGETDHVLKMFYTQKLYAQK